MRFEKGHKDRTYRRILDAASRRFRKDGVQATSLAHIMSDAGLTHGGFYAHFKSKDDLAQQAIVHSFERTRSQLVDAATRHKGLETIIRHYLSPTHRDQADLGCPAAALSTEIGRLSRKTRAVFAQQLNEHLDMIEHFLPGPHDPGEARARATALFGLAVGTLNLARAVGDRSEADRILAQGIQAALALASDRGPIIRPDGGP